MSQQPRIHRALNLAPAPTLPQGTPPRATLLDRMRDAVGDYPAHAPLEETETGRDTLDSLAVLQVAYAEAINGHSSVLAEAGFRDAVQIRKQKCGAAQPTLADVALLQVTMPEAFVRFLTSAANLAGCTIERRAKPGRTLGSSMADLQRLNGELTARYVEFQEDGVITPDERAELLGLVHQVRSIEQSLEQILGKRAGE